jgi:hypothetical protein
MVLVGFVVVALAFASIGVLLGAVLPSSRAAQALGVLLWFVLLNLGGAGPPPEALSGAMSTIGDLTVLRQANRSHPGRLAEPRSRLLVARSLRRHARRRTDGDSPVPVGMS